MQDITTRRLQRAERRAAETGLDLFPEQMLEAAELAQASDPHALAGIGRVDPFSHLVKP